MTATKRSKARLKVLRHEGHAAASHQALSRHAHETAQKRGPSLRHQAAEKAAHSRKKGGTSSSTKAGKYVHDEIRHIREGKHGARSTKQAIAIGLSKARKAGVKLPPRKKAA